MKPVLIAGIIITFIFQACKEAGNKQTDTPAAKENLPVKQDTFLTVNLSGSPNYIQEGTILDSSKFRIGGTKTFNTARYPRLSQNEFPEAVKWIKDLVDGNNETATDTQKEMADDEIFGSSTGTKLFYKDNTILSIVMDEWITDGQHRSVWTHYAFNYDRQKRKQIYVHDFFMLQSAADTIFLNHVLSRATGAREDELDIKKYIEWGESFRFATDSSNVYFFFDRYDMPSVGIGDWISVIPKKYIREHIRPEYR